MRAARRLGLGIASLAALSVLALPAVAADDLSISAAAGKSAVFAEHTCAHDKLCVDHGVSNCYRQDPRVVFCRIVIQRHTEAQGKYRCSRLIRLGFIPKTHRVPVTGLGRWHCGDHAVP
ncbi:MAG: hypothetical protein QOF23_430 [Solirubrobacterales bacterium]|jgi:hypothetical protein|nr:hypothetical protein [Solirubrobacterales bacterium]